MLWRFGILLCAWTLFAQPPLKFMGRTVRVVLPDYADKDQTSPEGPAKVCIDAPLRCYTAPDEFGGYGRDVKVDLVQLDQAKQAILFSAATGGVSGWSVDFALLTIQADGSIDNALIASPVCEVNQHALWWEPSISSAKIFLTANAEWGVEETHHSAHRYTISAYTIFESENSTAWSYWLTDRFMTVKQYEEDAPIFDSEKPEILARLKRVKRVKQKSPRQ